VYASLERTAKILEKHFRNMQDMEFTIERGKFYMLQTRNGKRTAQAAVKIAIDMQSEGLISKKEALMMVEPEQLQRLFYKQIDQSKAPTPLTRGLPASPGAVSGKVVFELNDAINARAKNEKTILVRPETTPEDIAGIAASDGILTSRGGMTSHAAVVTRGMGKPCIVGAEEVHIDSRGKSFMIGRKPIRVGDMITIDGSDGSVYYGELELVEPKVTSDISRLLQWSNEYKRLGIRANADTPEMVRKAIENGAEGVGLARTERMFNSKDRLELVRKMILSSSVEERKKYLDMIKPMQKKDFREMLAIAKGRPFTIRLLDIPLHEFLPKLEDLLP
jgi:pyruvate,orthophosphate dikinase